MACKPRCDPANESVVSELKNFELAFFGAIQKTCVNGQVVWTLPCNLAQGMACYPREANEGVACYILRLFELFGLVASGAWDVNVQYCERAFVTYGGQGYVALVINQAQQPDLFPAVWELYIAKGADGLNIPSPLTTKGDIWGYDTANNRIPVGPNNTVLIADSAQALGVRWGNVVSVNTASSLGTGEPVYAGTVGNDFQFKSLVAGTGVTMSSTGSEVTINSSAVGNIIILQDQKTAGTAGGTFTSGAWRTRVLNTEVVDTGGDCTLAANQFTLAAGTYRVEATAAANQVNGSGMRIQNITDATTAVDGMSAYAQAGADNNIMAFLYGRFTIAVSKTFELQHICETTRATNGFGFQSTVLPMEIYATVTLIKE